MEDIEREITEALVEMPIRFQIGDSKYTIKPRTLGKEIILKSYTKQLEIDAYNASESIYGELLHVCSIRTKEAARVIAIYTMDDRDEMTDSDAIEQKADEIIAATSIEDMATLLYLCLDEGGKVDRFLKYTKLDIDRDNIRKCNEVKDRTNSFVFCGKTIYGQIIGTACERYGWTYEYVLWGLSYTNLQMMLSDYPTSIHLSDEERRKVPLRNVHDSIDASDPSNNERLMKMFE